MCIVLAIIGALVVFAVMYVIRGLRLYIADQEELARELAAKHNTQTDPDQPQ
jgi:hypothetical protein